MIDCAVLSEPLDPVAMQNRAANPDCGAVAVFLGTARNSSTQHAGGRVIRLDYEAYVPMAKLEMERIAAEAAEHFAVASVQVHHRTGAVALTEPSVAVVVAAPRRAAAFDACRYVIEELKQRVPIWKKEVFDDGSEWVSPRP